MTYPAKYVTEAIRLHKQGKTRPEIAQAIGCSLCAVTNWLRNVGYHRRWQPLDLRDKAIAEYANGLTMREVCTKHHIGETRLRAWLEEKQIRIRSFQDPIYSADHSYFNLLDTPDKVYWAGFILADGCIADKQNGQMTLNIVIHSRDRSHLEKFRNCLQSNNPIKNRNNCVSLRITSDPLCQALISHGITPRKSLTASPLNILPQFRKDYFRGLFDGDGSISYLANHQKWCITLTGTYAIVEDFSIWSGCHGKHIYKHRDSNCYGFAKQSLDGVYDILTRLYSDSTTYLDRKFTLYKQLCEVYDLTLFPIV